MPEMKTDIEIGGILCPTCRTLIDGGGAEEAGCPVCGTHARVRIKESVRRTWALIIAAAVLYIPANLLPVMDVSLLGESYKSTILEGVIEFYKADMFFICAVVFVASFVVPIFKMTVLFYLLVTMRHSRLTSLQKTRLYFIVELIGKWSMLDVYVVAVMAGLVNSGFVINITGGWGIVFFAAVVLLTMQASASFDPRLIWDKCYEK